MKNNLSTLSLGFLILSVVLYSMVISPMSDSLRKSRQELEVARARHMEVESGIRQRDQLAKQQETLTSESAACRELLISPMLNSYSMQAKSFLDTMAHEAGLLNVEYSEGELRALPIPREQLPTDRTARRSVRIRAIGDYAAAISFLLRAEKELPLMALQSLSIVPMERNSSPENQQIEMVVEWPCEGEVFK